jgi:hypothetical protein
MTGHEWQAHEDLRQSRLSTVEALSVNFVLTVLKKRLLSSPRTFVAPCITYPGHGWK